MSVYHEQTPFGGGGRFPPLPITALSFDPVSDALWAGNASGQVQCYHGGTRLRGVSYFAWRGEPVKRLIASENAVTACTSTNLGAWGKGGINKWLFPHPQKGLITFDTHLARPNTLVVAQQAPELMFLNSSKGTLSKSLAVPAAVNSLRSSHSAIISGSADGYLRLHDVAAPSRSSEDQSEGSILAHVGGIQSIDVSGNYAVTIGWSSRNGHLFPDPLVKVFDLRFLRPLPPIQFTSGPAFINMHPRKSSLLTVTSVQGLVNIVDVSKAGEGGEFYQLDVSSYVSAVAVSPTGAYLAFGDAEGMIHTLSSASQEEHVPFNGFEGKSVEWADTPDPLPRVDWDDRTPLNRIGLPYYDSYLLSSYDRVLAPSSSYTPSVPKIPQQVLQAVRTQDQLQYAMLPKELQGLRNVVKSSGTSRGASEGRFRSDLARRAASGSTSNASLGGSDILHPEIPEMYRRVGIKYSKFGVEDFDFGFYNKTPYSGLETDIPNSYANALIQLLHYTQPIRTVAKSHITINCRTEHCLLCEFGFVARMLEDAKGINLQARNLCVTIGRKPSASSFGLVDRSVGGEHSDYGSMIQTLNRFVLEEFAVEGNAPSNPRLVADPHVAHGAPPITQLLGVDGKIITTCASCGFSKNKDTISHVVDLIYPRKPGRPGDPVAGLDFTSILKSSLERDIVYKSMCQNCKHLSNHRSARGLSRKHLPPILAINAGVNTDEQLRFWQDPSNSSTPKFLVPSVAIHVRNDDQSKAIDKDASSNPVVYDLRGYIAEIKVGSDRHLVAVVKTPRLEPVPDALDDFPPQPGGWHVFNDFAVQHITEEEALAFPGRWKIPCVLYLERRDAVDTLDYSDLPQQLDREILSQTISLASHVDWKAVKHEVLHPSELPTPGTVVAIDAEFVALQQEESEIRSDGTKRILKPSQLSLARVSVIRGLDGAKSGIPFIDDYIHTSDTIVDYLTEYSGIQPGDLHPSYSTHVLLPLKVVYKKLRLLIDLGCIFIGHGLSKDFRIINIFVPPERVIDTVDVYYIQSRFRRLSLRFLSHIVLKEEIQVDTHDSIEDARAALMLYREFQLHEQEGDFDDFLLQVYDEGKKLNWKIPEKPKEPTTPHSYQGPSNVVPGGIGPPPLGMFQLPPGTPFPSVFMQWQPPAR